MNARCYCGICLPWGDPDPVEQVAAATAVEAVADVPVHAVEDVAHAVASDDGMPEVE